MLARFNEEETFDEAFVSEGWDSMKALLDQEMPVKKKRRPVFFWIFWGIGSVLFLLGGWFFWQLENQQDQPLQEPIESPSSPTSVATVKENTPLEDMTASTVTTLPTSTAVTAMLIDTAQITQALAAAESMLQNEEDITSTQPNTVEANQSPPKTFVNTSSLSSSTQSSPLLASISLKPIKQTSNLVSPTQTPEANQKWELGLLATYQRDVAGKPTYSFGTSLGMRLKPRWNLRINSTLGRTNITESSMLITELDSNLIVVDTNFPPPELEVNNILQDTTHIRKTQAHTILQMGVALEYRLHHRLNLTTGLQYRHIFGIAQQEDLFAADLSSARFVTPSLASTPTASIYLWEIGLRIHLNERLSLDAAYQQTFGVSQSYFEFGVQYALFSF